MGKAIGRIEILRDPSEDPLTVDLGASAAQVANEIIRLLGNSVTISQGAAA